MRNGIPEKKENGLENSSKYGDLRESYKLLRRRGNGGVQGNTKGDCVSGRTCLLRGRAAGQPRGKGGGSSEGKGGGDRNMKKVNKEHHGKKK